MANQRRRRVREELARARLDARALLSPDDVEALVTQMDASTEAARVRSAMDSLAEPYREVLLLIGESSLSSAITRSTRALRSQAPRRPTRRFASCQASLASNRSVQSSRRTVSPNCRRVAPHPGGR